jgi:GTP-binding protein
VSDIFTPEDLEAGRLLFAKPASFLRSVVALEGLPEPTCPEITVVGRSNVGKSSLLNALMGRGSLVRTSNTPGRTQELNFFDIGDPAAPMLRLVDLPGYGYAQVSRSKVKVWTRLLKDYLRGRVNLKRAFVLIDTRHGAKDVDLEMMDLLDEAAVSYQLVLTKADKLNRDAQTRAMTAATAVARAHTAAHPVVCLSSAEENWGIAELRATIAGLMD